MAYCSHCGAAALALAQTANSGVDVHFEDEKTGVVTAGDKRTGRIVITPGNR